MFFELSLHHEKGDETFIAILHAVQHTAFLCAFQQWAELFVALL